MFWSWLQKHYLSMYTIGHIFQFNLVLAIPYCDICYSPAGHYRYLNLSLVVFLLQFLFLELMRTPRPRVGAEMLLF